MQNIIILNVWSMENVNYVFSLPYLNSSYGENVNGMPTIYANRFETKATK